MSQECVKFKKLDPSAIIPARATPLSAGFDLYALRDTTIEVGQGTVLVPTGIAVQLPEGTYGRVAMRSGLAKNQHLAVSGGVIDIDYRGPIGVLVYCTLTTPAYLPTSSQSIHIKKGDRFAQLIIERISYAPSIEVKELDDVDVCTYRTDRTDCTDRTDHTDHKVRTDRTDHTDHKVRIDRTVHAGFGSTGK